MIISLIAAASENNVIGRNNAIPWHLPDDLKFFRQTTQGNPVIMGRKNYESIVSAVGGPLPNRTNIVITRNPNYFAPGCLVVASLEEAVMVAGNENSEEMFIIGGGEIYRQAMAMADRIYLTRVHAWVAGDVVFPEIDADLWQEKGRIEHPADDRHTFAFTILTYERADR